MGFDRLDFRLIKSGVRWRAGDLGGGGMTGLLRKRTGDNAGSHPRGPAKAFSLSVRATA